MPNTIRLQAISYSAGTIAVPIVELQERTIQSFSATYTAGEWNPDNNYNWIPGSFVDFTPRRPDSRITYYYRAPHAWVGASHAISHWRFFVNGSTWFWHNGVSKRSPGKCVGQEFQYYVSGPDFACPMVAR
jgi:hypothetical protein